MIFPLLFGSIFFHYIKNLGKIFMHPFTFQVAPALAMGNTVVLKPATYTRLSALLFAEICAEAGLPRGVFNVVTGGGAMGQILAEHSLVDKVRSIET